MYRMHVSSASDKVSLRFILFILPAKSICNTCSVIARFVNSVLVRLRVVSLGIARSIGVWVIVDGAWRI